MQRQLPSPPRSITAFCAHAWAHYSNTCAASQVIAWANKSCDAGYPDTCLYWAGFLAKLAIHYDQVSGGHADVSIMNRVSHH